MKHELLLDNADSEWLMMFDTNTGNMTWDLMFSLMSKIKKDLKKMDCTVSALGRLLGILLYSMDYDTWIADNEVYEDERKFSKWFSDYSQAWKEILKRSDQELGLALEGGRDGGYRSALLEMLGGWQRETNNLLDDLYNDEWTGQGFNVKVDIVEAKEKDADAESDASTEADIETGSKKGSSGSKQAAQEGTSSQRPGKSKDRARGSDKDEGKGKGKGTGKGTGTGKGKGKGN